MIYLMKNGEIVQFIKNHYVSVFGFVVVVVSACFGIYRCCKSVPISFNAKRNRTTIVVENPFADSVKPKKNE